MFHYAVTVRRVIFDNEGLVVRSVPVASFVSNQHSSLRDLVSLIDDIFDFGSGGPVEFERECFVFENSDIDETSRYLAPPVFEVLCDLPIPE